MLELARRWAERIRRGGSDPGEPVRVALIASPAVDGHGDVRYRVRETAQWILDQVDLDDDEGALNLADEVAADWPAEDRRELLRQLGFDRS